MTVRFRKLDERRCPVSVIIDNDNEFKMPSDLRSDPSMPHDLWNFILEREFGLKYETFGQLVEGDDAVRFVKVNSAPMGRKAARQKIGDKNLASEGFDELARSEHEAIVCLHRWITRSTNKGLRKRALEGAIHFRQSRQHHVQNGYAELTVVETPIGEHYEVKW